MACERCKKNSTHWQQNTQTGAITQYTSHVTLVNEPRHEWVSGGHFRRHAANACALCQSKTDFRWRYSLLIRFVTSRSRIGNLCYRQQATSPVCWHRDTVRAKDDDNTGDEEFCGRRPHIWNSLPAAIRTATLSPLAFARHLKTHLFDWDWQRVWGLFRTHSTNLRIIIIIINIHAFQLRLI